MVGDINVFMKLMMIDSTIPRIDVDKANEILIRKLSMTTLLASALVISIAVNSGNAFMMPRKVPKMPPTIKILGRIFKTSLVRLSEKIPSTRLKIGFDANTLFEISWKYSGLKYNLKSCRAQNAIL